MFLVPVTKGRSPGVLLSYGLKTCRSLRCHAPSMCAKPWAGRATMAAWLFRWWWRQFKCARAAAAAAAGGNQGAGRTRARVGAKLRQRRFQRICRKKCFLVMVTKGRSSGVLPSYGLKTCRSLRCHAPSMCAKSWAGRAAMTDWLFRWWWWWRWFQFKCARAAAAAATSGNQGAGRTRARIRAKLRQRGFQRICRKKCFGCR